MVKSALRMNTEAQKERQAAQRRMEAEQRGGGVANASGFGSGNSGSSSSFSGSNSVIGGDSRYNAAQNGNVSGAGGGSNSGAADAGASTDATSIYSNFKTGGTPSGNAAARASETDAGATRSPQEERLGVFASARRGAAEYLESHGHAVVYGVIGFVAAALILIVGFWPTVLLALFAAIGVAVGRYRDGDQKTQVAFRSLIGRMR